MSEREDHEFWPEKRVKSGRARVCKWCASGVKAGPQSQPVADAEVRTTIPADYRVSGLAFAMPGGYARNVDGDWWRVQGDKLRPIWADDVRARVLAVGKSEINRILGEQR